MMNDEQQPEWCGPQIDCFSSPEKLRKYYESFSRNGWMFSKNNFVSLSTRCFPSACSLNSNFPPPDVGEKGFALLWL